MRNSLLLLFTLFTTCYSVFPPDIITNFESLSEDLRIGELAFTIEATDADGDELIYGIDETAQAFNPFTVDEATGEVRIKTELDFETMPTFTVRVFVQEKVPDPFTTHRVIHIVVMNANDNAPVFVNLPYNRNLPENTAVGTSVLQVSATDLDEKPVFRGSFRINEATPPEGVNVFQINPVSGEVTLKEQLNFAEKSTFYQLQIIASDGGGPYLGNPNHVQSASTTAFITIIDVPDQDPEFLNLPGSARVKEHSATGTSVFKVHSRDPDMGVNDKIHYAIEEASVTGLFEINTDTGEITVVSDIDREAILDGRVTLTVKATESELDVNNIHASATSTLTILVEDINDQPPLFYKCEGDVCTEASSFTGEVDEHSSVGLSITGLDMKVEDKDAGENSRFQLSLEGPDKDAFSVTPTVGISDMSKRDVLVLIRNPSKVDFETKQTMIVEVVAMDAVENTFVTTATVTIQVKDINDNIPKFENDAYNLNVVEHSENDIIVATITATDDDALDDGLLTYRLLPDNIRPLFDVFPKNGTVYVKNGKSLDREQRDSYSATLQAEDSVGNVGTTVLEIKIDDINDETPKFIRNSYEVFVRENQMLDEEVEARDADEPGSPNSKIIYGIADGEFRANFTIDADTGKITNKETLDRESIDRRLNGRIALNVTATDMGTPPLSSWVPFTITVEDINDNSPVFEKPVYRFSVNESQKGVTVGFVYATDADQTEINNRLTFRIRSSSGGIFQSLSQSLDLGYQGTILLDPEVELDYESETKNYLLIVEAADLGGNTATCTVHVEVEDVNDTPPIFPSALTWSTEENARAGNEIGTIVGQDLDTKHELIYQLISTSCFANSTWNPCEEQWFVVEPTGVVKIADGVTIDYEKVTQVKMTARVVDIKTEKRQNSTEGVITINIIDMNDNAPTFIPQQDFFVLISESVEADRSVARVYATDLDSGENKKIEFQVTLVQFESIVPGEGLTPSDAVFFAETEQPDDRGNYRGVIRSRGTLQADKKGKYLVTVEAKNGELSTNLTLNLITVDNSFRVNLQFDTSVAEVNENLPFIREALVGATKAMVHIVRVIADVSSTTRAMVTVVESYFVYLNATALTSGEVNRILNTQEVYEDYGITLQQFGLRGIGGTIEPVKEDNTIFYLMVGLVAGLVVVLVTTTTSMVCIRKKYKTKLKAAKAMNTAAMANDEYQKNGPVVPGTNKYNKDGANPILNLNIDAATDLGFDEEASSADRESLNSLDDNMDMRMDDKDTMSMTIIEEEEEYDDDSSYIEPLGAALAQRGRKTLDDRSNFTFDNPSLSTTDL